ncbi:MAG: hypothetical protein ACI4I9_07455 [Porcipelethomonas sp.]
MAKKRSILDRYPVTQKYIVSRGQALKFPAAPFKKEIADDEVYGAVIDMPMTPTVMATLVCFINGAANLYFNLGGEYINSAQRYRGVAQASFDFIRNVTPHLGICQKTTKFDMPVAGKHYIYLLTKKGVYKTEITPNAISKDDDSKRKIFNMYQRVMGELRIAQMKDQAAGTSSGSVSE